MFFIISLNLLDAIKIEKMFFNEFKCLAKIV